MLMVIELYPDGEPATAAQPLDSLKYLANKAGFQVINSLSCESAVRRIELDASVPLERRTFLALVDEVPEGQLSGETAARRFVDLSLSEAEMQLIERLLNAERAALAANDGGETVERDQVEGLLRRLSHPMRGGGHQDESALLTDVGASIAPEITAEARRRLEEGSS